MSTSAIEMQEARAQRVEVREDVLVVDLADGRTITAPLAWYPRLWHGNEQERAHFEIMGDGAYIHWPDLDEDISAENLIFGQPSGESQKSFQKWQESRKKSK